MLIHSTQGGNIIFQVSLSVKHTFFLASHPIKPGCWPRSAFAIHFSIFYLDMFLNSIIFALIFIYKYACSLETTAKSLV